MKYKRKYKKGGKFKYQTGGPVDPPRGYGADFDPLGDSIRGFFGVNTNPNASIPMDTPYSEPPVTMTTSGAALGSRGIQPTFERTPSRFPIDPNFYKQFPDLVTNLNFGTPKPQIEAQQPNPQPVANPVNTNFNAPSNGGINPWMGADNPITTQDLPAMDIPQGELTEATVPEGRPASVSETAGVGNQASGIGGDLLQFAPDIMNFATGVFGKDETRPATRVSQRGVGMIDDRVNVRPQLMAARRNYRAIIADPNASPNQKLAAQAQLNAQESQIFADKFNREIQLKTNKARLQSQLDSQQAQYDEQFRQDKMASEANLGITGNFARQALGNISTKMLQKKAEEAKRTGDMRDILTLIESLPPAAQTRILENYDLN